MADPPRLAHSSDCIRMNTDNTQLIARIEQLERANRRLMLAAISGMIAPVLVIAGWKQAPTVPDVLQAHKLEIVDQHGVPLVTLNTGRNDEGGAVTLRDKDGERRAWWTSSPDGSNLGLVKEHDPKKEGSYVAGMSVGATAAEMNLISPQNGMLSATIRDDKPRLDLWGIKGNSVFAAPFK